jgi:hypothetical protein
MIAVCMIRLMLRRRVWRIDRRVIGAGEAARGEWAPLSLPFLTSRDEVGQTTKACSLTLRLTTASAPHPG